MKANLWLPLIVSGAIHSSLADVDPTRPLGHSAPDKTAGNNFQLSSIVFSEQRQVAIINDKLVHEGETVAGAKVVKIMQDRVQLSVNGKRRELTLNSTTVKRTTVRSGK